MSMFPNARGSKWRYGLIVGLMVLLTAFVLGGCPKPQPPPPVVDQASPAPPPPASPAGTTARENAREESKPVQGDKTVLVIKTDKGDITAELFDKQTPITAGNFLLLAEEGFYNGLTFHRVVPGFVIQGGDPEGTGAGGPGFTIPDETGKGFKHERGILSMAKTAAPNSAGSQFFIIIGPREAVSHLDRDFSPFGKVTEGMDVADKIKQGDKINDIEVKSVSPDAEAARKAAKAARKTK